MRTMQTRKLTGWPLRWAVARAVGRHCMIRDGQIIEMTAKGLRPYTPDLIADKNDVMANGRGIITISRNGEFVATCVDTTATAPTKGLAVCRCLLLRQVGETILIPEGLQ